MKLKDAAASVEQSAATKLARGSVDLALPLYGGRYAGRFGVVNAERIREIEQSNPTTEAERLDLNAQFVADALRTILYVAAPGAKPEPLVHDDGRPVGFDEDFAAGLELEPAPDRGAFASSVDVVLACWTVEDVEGGARELNGPALNVFSIRLLDWMQDTTRTVVGELVGESNGTRR